MDFIGVSADYFSHTVLTVGCCLALAGSALLLFAFSQRIFLKLPEWIWPTYAMIAFFGLSAFSLVGYMFVMTGESQGITSKITEEAKATYGVELERFEILTDLEYPEMKPEKDLQIFGSVERDGEEIYLVWRDDRFELASLESAKSFVELPRN